MGEKLYLISVMPPSVNHYLAYRTMIKNGKPIGISYKTKQAKEYQEGFIKYVQKEAVLQNWFKRDESYYHLYVDTVFYFPREDMDCNNYFKVMLDAITDSGSVWKDDNQVCERVNRIYIDSKNPRIELVIYPVEYTGIFDNTHEKKLFIEKCKTCHRYDKACKILDKALRGHIQEEISMNNCLKFKVKKMEKKGEKGNG